MPTTWTILYIVALVAAGYFLLVRPQQKRAKEQAALMASLRPGERVMTAGGMFGTIERVDDDTIELRIADGVVIDMARSSVVRTVDESAAPRTDAEPESLDEPAADEVVEPHVHVDGSEHDEAAETGAGDAEKGE